MSVGLSCSFQDPRILDLHTIICIRHSTLTGQQPWPSRLAAGLILTPKSPKLISIYNIIKLYYTPLMQGSRRTWSSPNTLHVALCLHAANPLAMDETACSSAPLVTCSFGSDVKRLSGLRSPNRKTWEMENNAFWWTQISSMLIFLLNLLCVKIKTTTIPTENQRWKSMRSSWPAKSHLDL